VALRIALLTSLLATIGSALLFNAVDANPALAVLVYALIAVMSGIAIAVFGSQIPEPPKWLRDLSRGSRHTQHKS
jgi:hypothetical protein